MRLFKDLNKYKKLRSDFVTAFLRRDFPGHLNHKLPVSINHLAIHQDLRILPEVADHVPVDVALVLAAGLRVACPQRHVEGTADFLIEQDALCKTVDFKIRTDSKFTDIARPRVCFQVLQ